jgi:hypothetical protein
MTNLDTNIVNTLVAADAFFYLTLTIIHTDGATQSKTSVRICGFLHSRNTTGEGNAHVFLAVDAYLDFVFNLNVERDKSPDTVLKNIYLLTEHRDFSEHLGKGFTLVLEEFQELAPRIESIIKPSGGKILFDKPYNNTLANPVLLHMHEMMKGRSSR